MTINFRVEFEPRQIRHIAVQCPYCHKWFYGHEISHDDLRFEYEIEFAKFYCPICDRDFSVYEYNDNPYAERNKKHIENYGYPEVYNDCLRKKEVWE